MSRIGKLPVAVPSGVDVSIDGPVVTVKGPKGMRPSIRRYTDKQFHYLEVSMPGLEGVEADICIHDGCIYVRTAR